MKFQEGNAEWKKRKTNGRGRRVTEERYLALLLSKLTPDKWSAIIDKAIALAEKGDDRARKFLAEYAIGKPTEYVNADVTSDGERILSDEERIARLAAIFDAARVRRDRQADLGQDAQL